MARNEVTHEEYAHETETDAEVRSISLINMLLGAWLIVTPFWFGYTSAAARWDQIIIGIVVIVLAALRALVPTQRWLSYLTGIAGLWAIVAPFILGYNRAGAYWNSVVVGIIVAVLAFYNGNLGSAGNRMHHTHA